MEEITNIEKAKITELFSRAFKRVNQEQKSNASETVTSTIRK
jgi:hypothetical protein